jgi:hypothetical protein
VARRSEEEFLVWFGARPFDPAKVAGSTPAADAPAATAFIVQFSAALTEPDMVRLRAEYGLALNSFVPELSYIERLPPDAVARVREDFLIRAVAPLQPEMKLGLSIGTDVPAELVASMFEDADPADLATVLGAVEAGDVRVQDDRAEGGPLRMVFTLDDLAGISQLAAVPEVQSIDRIDPLRALGTPDAATIQSGSPTKPTIWDHKLHGEGQVIGVIDEGPLDLRHCFFAGPAPNTPGPGHRKVLEHRNLRKPDGTAVPLNDHAMFVAGIAAGDELGNEGKHPDRGGAYAARLVCGTFDGLVANGIWAELDKSAKAGAVIHNNSYNQVQKQIGEYTPWGREVDLFCSQREDHLVVAGAGNAFDVDPSGNLIPGNLSPPGIAKNALCVTAAKAHPDHMEIGGGIFGPTSDGRRKPELAAVGCGTRSAQKNTPCNTVPLPCGTSMAVPSASAAAALARQYFLEGWYPSGEKRAADSVTPTGALLKAVLLNSTVDMTGEQGYPGNFEGWGLIQLERTLFFKGDPRSLVVWDVRHVNGLARHETRRHSLVSGATAEQLKITLVWTDVPPEPGAFDKPAVNNLDLTVTAPDGVLFRGNDLTNGVSTPGGIQLDTVNTVEMVIVDNPRRGEWTIAVEASDIYSFGHQGYAVVASGGKLRPLLKAGSQP